MSQPLTPIRLRAAGPSRRSFLRYTGASAVVGSLWLAGCKKDDTPPAPSPPALSAFSPGSGSPGTTVTLTGTNLAGATAVTVGGAATQFTVVSATTITFTVPTGASSGVIAVTTPAGTATSGTPFTVTAAPSTAPTIASFAPASALPGATVVVTGTNLTGATGLTVNGTAATFTVQSATSLSFQVPAAAAAGVATVVVTGPGGTGTNNSGFTVLPSTVSVGTGDTGVLNYAYALEQLEAAFYTQVRAGSYYASTATAAEKLAFDDLYYHEVIHREVLKAALGSNALKDLTPDFSSISFSSRASVLGAAKAFEDLGSAAYIGVAQNLTSPAYLFLAGKIASVEARHAALVRDLLQEGTFVGSDIASSSSLEIAKRPNDVAAVANTYLAVGSKLDVSGIA